MRVKITPRTLSGTVQAVASKSHAHRLLIASALSDKPAEVSIHTTSQDIEATKDCLSHLKDDMTVLNCHESGSTLRFLIPVTMALKDEAIFMGSGRLPHRPLSPLDDEMEAHGCTFMKNDPEGEELQEICRIKGRLQGGRYTLPGNVSSQYITGLLFALPLLDEDSKIEITSPLESSKYVDMTLDVLEEFGITIYDEIADGCPIYKIPGRQAYTAPEKAAAEGDWSNIAFWIIAGILSQGSGITCTGISETSSQGDKEVVAVAKAFGGDVVQDPQKVTVKAGKLASTRIDASEIPDLVPILSVAAAVAEGTTEIYNAGRLRIKESDRLAAMADCLNRVGAKVTEKPEGLVIEGVKKLKGGTVSGYNDHRIVMAMAIASIVSDEPIIIEGAEAINKSYPGFFEDLKALGGEVRVI